MPPHPLVGQRVRYYLPGLRPGIWSGRVLAVDEKTARLRITLEEPGYEVDIPLHALRSIYDPERQIWKEIPFPDRRSG
ncbi:MAG: hypothetical protein IMW90_04945 [Thermogemmatispora sp.]|jgi:hypothetical protein|uniref:hypothetical protein n=1 Tax=Thermogemmatispora TaxID=768669 RepID=UPI00124CC1B7|nr:MULTISPECIES: hypothetical protein [Thermogemmatispora]MBE3565054.1 hypothetical protein [Thermogemmatispora sp.]GER84073.1 hypothetical protein KTAU_27100 [Thermogemmatispora aurantia]